MSTAHRPSHNRTVLLVDDDAAIREILCTLFESAGFRICAEASNGAEAIEQAVKHKPDLIVLDLSMPIMDGLQASRVLRGILPTTPFLLFTMHADSVSTKDARAAGISSVVSKSDVDTLIREAEVHLKLRKFAAGG